MDEHTETLLREFLDENWGRFVEFCGERGEDPHKIYTEELNGDEE